MFSPFFFDRLPKSLRGYDYQGVKMWPDRAGIDVKKLELILFPVNLENNHWILSAVDLRSREFIYMDSLGNRDKHGVLGFLMKWLSDEVREKYGDKIGNEMCIPSWKKVENPKFVPEQLDDGSCGVFVMYIADHLELCRNIEFTQEDIPILRKRTAFFLSRNRLADHPL